MLKHMSAALSGVTGTGAAFLGSRKVTSRREAPEAATFVGGRLPAEKKADDARIALGANSRVQKKNANGEIKLKKQNILWPQGELNALRVR